MKEEAIDAFLSQYDEKVITTVLKVRDLVMKQLPGIGEELDLPARMIAYSYGRKYSELICVIFPSKKGVKLGFNRGVELPDPDGLLEGTGKISRYVQIPLTGKIPAVAIRRLLKSALALYRKTKDERK
jgi:hypothetical protein